MGFGHQLSNLFSYPRNRASRRPHRIVNRAATSAFMGMEALESRQLMSTVTQTLNFPQAGASFANHTDWTDTQYINQFNPTLGTLTEVDISYNGSMTTQIKVENVSSSSADTITSSVSGNMTVSGQAIGASVGLANVSDAHSDTFGIFDGNLDYAGVSGMSYTPVTGSNGSSLTVTNSLALAPFMGTGTLAYGMDAHAVSNAIDTAGNFAADIETVATGKITITYQYTPFGVLHGETGTIGFWANKNGQQLINLLGATPTSLSSWLSSNYPNLYGKYAGKANNLTGATRSTVAAYFITLFNTANPPKLEAQVLATALAVYTTTNTLNSTLAGQSFAMQHGFVLSAPSSPSNLANRLWNVGMDGPAFGVANNTSLTISALLLKANQYAVNGVLWANSIKIGTITYSSSTLRSMANEVFSGINQAGDITI